MEDDKEVSVWWNKVKDDDVWNGAIQGILWDELWDFAKEDLRKTYAQCVTD